MADDYLQRFLAFPGQETPAYFVLVIGYLGATEAALSLCETQPNPARQSTAVQVVTGLERCGNAFECARPLALVYQGWLGWLQRNPGRAARTGEQAILAAKRLEMPYVEGLAHFHLGRHLPAEDKRRDEHLQQAKTIFEQLGTIYELERTRLELA
jgi:hypothetical protein